MEKPERDFAEALRQAAADRVTVDLPVIWQCFHAVRPELRSAIPSRSRLADDLRALADAGILSFPASKTSFDRVALPPLPQFVRFLSAPAAADPRFDHQTFPWSLPMSFVASLARVPNPEQARRLNDFFRKGGASRPMVPVKERSYGIFGDEKILERILDGQLGYEGRLTMELLRCYRVPLVPVNLAFEQAGPDVLIVENEATFDTVVRWNRERRQFRVVIYGRGKEVEKTEHYLLQEIQAKPGSIYYFGDLDRHGLEMPHRLSRRLAQQGGRPLRPALSCYRLLLAQAPTAVTALEGIDDYDSTLHDSSPGWQVALEWLPPEIRSQAYATLLTDQRIAQEATGWELLQHQSTLI